MGRWEEWVGEALGETLGSTSDRSWSLSAVCLPHTPKLHVRDKESAHCRGTTSPLPSSPCPSHFPQRVYEIGVSVMARINFTDGARTRRIRTCESCLVCLYPGFTALNGFVAL